MAHPVWPLFDLRVVTPRVELRYPDDGTIAALAELASRGVHDPATMPFGIPWTDAPTGGPLERSSMQFLWRSRTDWTPAKWDLPFAVFRDGELVGVQSIGAHDYATRRSFETGSWLGRPFQGQGLGTEMRAAILHFGFVGLGAEAAHTSAWHDNEPSLAVTRRLGYEPNGEAFEVRRGERDRQLAFRLTRADWAARQRDDIDIEGLAGCQVFFGLTDGW
jgi:RimJ/RimL family protein N-acetyltransferase